jgi:hypothetical protein
MEHEYYHEEYKGHFEDECEYDDEQLAYYYQDYIEDRKRDIRKQLIRRNQPAKTLRYSRWEKEMQLRRKLAKRKNRRRRSRSSFTRRSNSKSKRRRATRRGRR